MKKRHEQKLIILALFLLLAFNVPLLPLFSGSGHWLGIPVLYCYVFGIWMLSVGISLLIVKRYHE